MSVDCLAIMMSIVCTAVIKRFRDQGLAALIAMSCLPQALTAAPVSPPARTMASSALDLPSAAPATDLNPDLGWLFGMTTDQSVMFNLASANLLDDDECFKDEPLRAGMNFEKQLECQRQFLDVKIGH